MKVVGDTLTVTLKWSREKPIEVPVVRVMLNGVDAADAGFTVVSADNIAVKDPSLGEGAIRWVIELEERQ